MPLKSVTGEQAQILFYFLNRYEVEGDEERLQWWECKVLHKIYGPVNVEGHWKIWTNQELRELYGEQDIVNMIEAARIHWLGHVVRMRGSRIPKAAL